MNNLLIIYLIGLIPTILFMIWYPDPVTSRDDIRWEIFATLAYVILYPLFAPLVMYYILLSICGRLKDDD